MPLNSIQSIPNSLNWLILTASSREDTTSVHKDHMGVFLKSSSDLASGNFEDKSQWELYPVERCDMIAHQRLYTQSLKHLVELHHEN